MAEAELARRRCWRRSARRGGEWGAAIGERGSGVLRAGAELARARRRCWRRSACGGEERPDEVHGRGGEGSATEAEEEAGDDNEDVLGALLDGRGGDLRLGGGEGHGAADLVRAESV